MNFSTVIKQRGFGGELSHAGYELTLESFSKHAIGGPKVATWRARGSERALWDTVDLLRCPIESYDRHGAAVWWGYVNEILIQLPSGISWGVTLDSMSNRIACTYSQMDAVTEISGDRATTSWAQDDDSVSEFGAKSEMISISQATEEQALNWRDIQLSERGRPPKKISMSMSGAQEAQATIKARGWWSSLDWSYYTNLAGREGNETSGQGTADLGNASENQSAGQGFMLTGVAGWETNSARIRVKREGDPADNLVVQVCANAAGAPGGVLASGSVPGSSLPEYANWVTVSFSSRTFLTVGAQYWLVCTRSGSLDGGNYYKLDVNEDGVYPRGVLRLWNGSDWQDRSPAGDLNFTVGGVTETSQQLSAILTSTGQFFSGIEIEDASGIWTSPYRDGDQKGKACAEDLLRSGGTGRRLLAEVDSARQARVYLEPEKDPGKALLLLKNGAVMQGNAPIPGYLCPVGTWMQLKDVPLTAGTGRLVDPALVFIEEMTWDAQRDRLQLASRDTGSPYTQLMGA